MSKHRGEPRHCLTCGRAEDNHNVRHPFAHHAYGTAGFAGQAHPAGARRWDRA